MVYVVKASLPLRLPSPGIRSDQARGLLAWWPAGEKIPSRREVTRWGLATPNNAAVVSVLHPVLGYCSYLPTGNEAYSLTAQDIDVVQPYSLAAWVVPYKTDVSANPERWGAIISKGHTASSAPYTVLSLTNDNANPGHWRTTFASGGTSYGYIGGLAFAAYSVYHVVATYNKQTLLLYVNGVVDGAGAAYTGAVDQNAVAITIGRMSAATTYNHFAGLVGDVRIYNRALAPAEVWQLWAPETRWELYAPPRRQWVLSPTAPALSRTQVVWI